MLSYKPVTPSQRHLCLVNKKNLESKLFLKSLYCLKNKNTGRDNKGHITVYHKETGHKKRYRLVDFFYLKNIPYMVESIEYDPNRSSFLNLIYYKNGVYSFILSTHNIKLGNIYMYDMNIFPESKIGYRSLLINIPVGSIVHNISSTINEKAKYLRSAGTFGLLEKKKNGIAMIKLPLKSKDKNIDISETQVEIDTNTEIETNNYLTYSLFGSATMGRTSNISHRSINLGKAGRSRWLGRRPTVRGVAMNPVDHPHGGGEGKKSKKVSPTNKWGTVIKFSRKYKRKKY